MFTGIVTHRGRLVSVTPSGPDRRMVFAVEGEPLSGAAEGDSISVSGACLTMLDIAAGQGDWRFSADVSAETLDKTILGELQAGDPVNLEPALCAGDRLGGHLVTGHVDGRGALVSRTRVNVSDDGEGVPAAGPDGDGRVDSGAAGQSAAAVAENFRFRVPAGLARYIAAKGSVCIDGVSLTVNTVADDTFEVCIIPHTQAVTTLGALAPGQAVNIEVDLVARYLERLLAVRTS